MSRKRQSYHRDGRRDGISVSPHPNGRWRLRVWDRRLQRYRSSYHATEEGARAAGEERRADFVKGLDNAAACTLEAVWTAYKAERLEDGMAKPNTIKSMQAVVDGLREAGATDLKSPSFRSAVVRYFRTLDLSRTKAPDGRVAVSTRKRLLSQVRALLNFARRAGWLIADPLAGYSPVGAAEQDDTTRETFTIAEARKLVALNKPEDPVWVHVMLMLYAGLREAEARALTWADYDEEAGLLWVRKGKGNKVRNVPVQPELAEILERVSAVAGPKAKVACMPSSPIVRNVKGRAVTYQRYGALLTEAGVTQNRGTDPITGMPRRLNRHSCRHSFCAAMLATGQPGELLRIVMGHGEEDLTLLYGAQVATYAKQIAVERWTRGQLRLVAGG